MYSKPQMRINPIPNALPVASAENNLHTDAGRRSQSRPSPVAGRCRFDSLCRKRTGLALPTATSAWLAGACPPCHADTDQPAAVHAALSGTVIKTDRAGNRRRGRRRWTPAIGPARPSPSPKPRAAVVCPPWFLPRGRDVKILMRGFLCSRSCYLLLCGR